VDLKFDTDGVPLAPDPHDWLFQELQIMSGSRLALNFVKEHRSMELIISRFIGLDLLDVLPGNIVFEFKYTHVGESGYDSEIVKKFSKYFGEEIIKQASTFELSSSYGCKLVGAAQAQRNELQVSMG
jgi:hypothetical protein